jgi:hypothetical protein
MPGTPVDPYVAIKRTVALQMGRDPDEEVIMGPTAYYQLRY